MQDFAETFYSSQAWRNCRAAYKKSRRGLCEICLKQGRYTPGEIVHHKVHLSPANINDPDVSLNWNNLLLVCRDCHAAEHDAKKRRYKIDSCGRIITRT